MKTILITGINSGIGKALAIMAGKENHKLILIGRAGQKSLEAVREIKRETQNGNVDFIPCDLSLQNDVKRCCDLIQTRYDILDVLVNNAGVYSETRTETDEGIELTIAVNVFLAPFLFMKQLLELMQKSDEVRIINVSSIGERYGAIDFNDLMSSRSYSGNAVYNKSKLMLTMITYQFAKLYTSDKLLINAVHPGAVNTNLIKDADRIKMPTLLRLVFTIVKSFRKSPEAAASKIYSLMVDAKYKGISGRFFSNGNIILSSKQSTDQALMENVWRVCNEMIIV
jgi:NAD(P)-dependent dehydrogenase (short-subunit alcohol dehydrogenase family)